ncbi:multiple epidermal growth factor-like domains protein 10 isoform X1 [Haliotis rufescens]|uniref:multiple epidermal growth factor-like domains protein 10 isoform X1 n=1 Tax=Haliotis rufescens TaxID=6454 RepID=UPI00201F366D|nr:multiple epidermal growth factor-like domains protein 10 isoform X1 [Haliotis rufescens]
MAAWASVAFVIASLSLAAGVRQNVARNKTAWMSTTRQPSQSAGNAVDGVTTANSERYTAHTKVGESSAWWKVDLQTQVQSAQVTIYFRLDYKKRRNGLQLYTSVTNSSEPKDGSLCHTVTGSPDGTDIPGVLNVTCPGTWRYLTVYTNTSNDGQGAVLEFAEVEVWICASGYYGTNCDQRCDTRNCKFNSNCDVVQGQCVGGCAAGYQGTDCTQACTPGLYGDNCSKNCNSRHCLYTSDSCPSDTGACSGCQQGWTGPDCTACTSGYYGSNCGQRCAARQCKMASSCDGHGQCVGGCAAGYQGRDCIQACTSGYHGTNCGLRCDARHCKSDSSCDAIQGQCVGGCAAGYQGTDCLQGCGPGSYGERCSKDCSNRRCKTPSNTCNHTTGLCSDGCISGYKGDDCMQMCPSGSYGINCESTCGHCADNNTCHHVNGTCPGGCQAGWQLDLCQTGCDNGKFGVNCESDCGRCNGTCDTVDGRCLWGCAEGYIGSQCAVKLELQMDSAITPSTAGIIGLAAGICFTLILGVGLHVCLVRQGRLHWRSSSQKDAVTAKETQEPVDKNTTQPSDNYTSVSEQAGGRNIYNNDYAALDVEAKANSEYDVIKNQAYENL